MSTELTNKVWVHFPGGCSKLAVLMGIAEACNSEGNCGLPLAKLAGFSRVSVSTAFVAVKALRLDRWIVTSRIQGQGGTLVMQINLPKLNRSTRPDYDSDPPESDAACAARKVQQRRENRLARSSGSQFNSDSGLDAASAGIATTESRGAVARNQVTSERIP